MRNLRVLVSVLVLFLLCPVAFPQSRKEKKAAKVAASAKPKNVAGGIKLPVAKTYVDTYDVVLNWVKRADYTIESADKENGLITTAITITGGYSQTGTRLMITLIKDTDTTTIVKIVVTDQKRKKLLVAEPWSDPKVNDASTQKIADDLKAAL